MTDAYLLLIESSHSLRHAAAELVVQLLEDSGRQFFQEQVSLSSVYYIPSSCLHSRKHKDTQIQKVTEERAPSFWQAILRRIACMQCLPCALDSRCRWAEDENTLSHCRQL